MSVRFAIALLWLLLSVGSLHAQEDAATDVAPIAAEPAAVTEDEVADEESREGAEPDPEVIELTPLTESQVAALVTLKDKIAADDQIIRFLTARMDNVDGLIEEVTQARLDLLIKERYDSLIKAAKLVADHTDSERDVGDWHEWVIRDLPQLPVAIFGALDRIGDREIYPDQKLATIDMIEADQRLFTLIGDIAVGYGLLVDYLQISERLGLKVTDDNDAVVVRLGDAAANLSAFLDLSIRTASNVRAGLAILPGNEDLLGRQSAADARINLIANALQRLAGYLATLGVDVRRYRQQVLTATGEITTDVLDVGVVASLVSEWTLMLRDLAIEKGPSLIFQVLLLFIIVFIFHRASKLVDKVINRALDASKVRVSHLLRRMLVNTGRNLTVLLGVLIALSQIGISLGPLLAGLGIAGFIIGFAMQDSLSNFASGMLILFYRPFDVGDVVEAGGVYGTVKSMSLVNTTFMTFDNQTLVVPNNKIWQSVIKNVTAQTTRRVDLTFGISYSDDIEKAEKVFREACAAHDKCLSEPEPLIHLHELGDSSVNFIVRPWVNTDDYWDVYWGLMRDIYVRLGDAGVTIPFPQRDIHVIEHNPA